MRMLMALVAGLALLGMALLATTSFAPERAGAPAVPASAPPAAPRLAASEDRLEALERRFDELLAELASLRAELDAARDRREPREEVAPPPAPVPSGEHGPSWYLQQYAASFAHGGKGSEYFRLAVEAFAPSLLGEIGALVLDSRANLELRQRLLEMLGDARFRGQRQALDLCLRLLPARGAKGLVDAALGALEVIGDGATARALEGLLWSIESLADRWKAVQVLVALSGEEANAALVRLWPLADDADRAVLIVQVSPTESRSSLQLFELASCSSAGVRLAAARSIGEFRFDGFPVFIEAWSARESDPEVRSALGASRTSLSAAPRWSAQCATGPPDAEPDRDDPRAWAPAAPDMGLQWLELGYDPPLAASAVRIFEVCVPGAVVAVTALDEHGAHHELWAGTDSSSATGVLELAFGPTTFRVRTLRLTLDTDRRPGWNEIDAVELIGPSGRAWARSARASSSYGR
jgi:hypothetical protein